jgi:uncharacterized protein (TIGR02145 family)
MKPIAIFGCLLLTLALLCASVSQAGTVTDIDGNVYQTVTIGTQEWMAANLKVTHYRNGVAIPNVTDNSIWQGLPWGAYCDYNNDVNNVAVYGRLYNWYAAADSRNIAPVGWHVPSDAEWQTLVDFLGGGSVAGGKMKETGTAHWLSPNTGATNESGFSALAAGYRYFNGFFYGLGSYEAAFWSSTGYLSSYAWYRSLSRSSAQVLRNNDNKTGGYSIRCIKDPVSDDAYWDNSISPVGAGLDSVVRALTVYDNKLIVGGGFATAGGVSANYVASWNGNSWSSLGSGMNEWIHALAVYDGELIAGGNFTVAGGVAASRIASWDGSTWSPLGSGMNNRVFALTSFNQKPGDPHGLIALGEFTTAGGVTAKPIASWDGSSWKALGSGMNDNGLALTEYNNKLIAGGYFTTAGGLSANYIASWDGTQWSPLGLGMSSYVRALTVYNNKLIAGGSFVSAGGVSVNYIASWDGVSWSPLGSGLNGVVRALTVYDNKLIAGGDFGMAGGVAANRIASWDGSSWSPLGSGIGSYVRALTVYDTKLIVGGDFTVAGNKATAYLAAWTSASGSDIDGDGLLDMWEQYGYDFNSDGIVDVNLPAMGANPNHKDIFVEIDWMGAGPGESKSHKPTRAALKYIVDAFANSPATSPDGSTGINLHIDTGQGGLFSGGNEIPHQMVLGGITSFSYDWTAFDNIKMSNLAPARQKIFRYCVFAHQYGLVTNTSSGIARGIPASDFIVSLGGWATNPGTTAEQAGTFMHELGHTLGLRHGGGDDENYKPNFLSVMNYSWQTSGLRINSQDNNFDYSRFTLPNLNENSLNESVGLNGGPSIALYGTKYFCPTGGQKGVDRANNPIDWNCNGNSNESGVIRDVDNSGGTSSLTSLEEWSRISFVGGLVGSGLTQDSLPHVTTSPELTHEENLLIACCYGTRGNVNKEGIVDLADLSALVSYLTGGGYLLPCIDAANVNGAGIVDLADLSALVSYLTSGGYVLPSCP